MPKNEFILAGKKFITSKKAALLFGYTQDYIGQLCRGEKIDARRIGRTWYVSEKSILEHKRLFNGATVLKKEEIAPKDAKKLPVSFPESDSGKLPVGLGENEIPKIDEIIPMIAKSKVYCCKNSKGIPTRVIPTMARTAIAPSQTRWQTLCRLTIPRPAEVKPRLPRIF